jgi:hypothetical protein
MAVNVPELQNPEIAAQLEEALMGFVAEYGEAPLARVLEAFRYATGAETPDYPHPLQRPEEVFFPGLAVSPWHSAQGHASLEHVVKTLEDAFPVMREEYLQSQANGAGLDAYGAAGNQKFHTVKNNEDWSGLFLMRRGEWSEKGMKSCPRTAEVIRSLEPYIMADGEAFFSVLKPGVVLPPHHDATNLKFTIQMGVVIPSDSAIKVGDETKVWEPGKCILFDDSFLHEAWNHSDTTRVVFIMDVWRPELTPIEVEVIGALIRAMPRAAVAA